MSHVISFRLFLDTDTALLGGHGRFNVILYFHIQSNHPKYTILLMSIAELPELYISTNFGILIDKTLYKQETNWTTNSSSSWLTRDGW